MHYLSQFSTKFKNLALIFREFGRKVQIVGKFWENFEIFCSKFNRKIEFLTIFGIVVAKNIAFGNNIIFLQRIFLFHGDVPCVPPWLRPYERVKLIY